MKTHVTTKEAAKELYTTPYTVRKYIRAGKLAAAKIGKQYLIPKDELSLFLNEMTFKQKPKVG